MYISINLWHNISSLHFISQNSEFYSLTSLSYSKHYELDTNMFTLFNVKKTSSRQSY